MKKLLHVPRRATAGSLAAAAWPAIAGSLAAVAWLAIAGPAWADLTMLWSRTCGGPGNDGARALALTLDGGYILAGYTYSFGAGEGDILLVKTDATGREEWTRVLGGGGRDHGIGVCGTSDGGSVLTGYTMSAPGADKDLCVIKTDAEGGPVWSRTYGGERTDEGWAVKELGDGSLLVAGRTESRGAGGSDFYVLKLAADGDTVWTRTFGGAEWDWAYSLCETSDGNYGIVGTTGSTSGNRDIWAVKITPAGAALWTQAYGSLVAADADWGWAVHPTSEGGLVIAGHYNDHAVNDAGEAWLIYTDAAGAVEWSYTYGGTSYYEHGHGLCATDDGGYLACGIKKDPATQRNDLLLIKTDGDGNEQWLQTIALASRDWAAGILAIGPGRYTVGGYTDGAGAGRFDAWLVSLLDPTAQGGMPERGAILRLDAPAVSRDRVAIRFSLPADGDARLTILDVTGREVAQLQDRWLMSGSHEAVWEAAPRPSGVYYCRLATRGRTLTRRVTLVQ